MVDEESNRRLEQMTVSQNPYMYMEDVEKAKVEDEVSEKTGNTRIPRTHGG